MLTLEEPDPLNINLDSPFGPALKFELWLCVLKLLSMALGKVGKNFMAPLLAVNLVVHVIVVGLAGWSLDKYIDGEQNHPRTYPLYLSSFIDFIFYITLNGHTILSFDEFKLEGRPFCVILGADLGGNTSTSFMLIFALIAGTFGACSVIIGMMHLRAWQHESHAAAASVAIISWAMIALAFGYLTPN